ncbi:hypothetical protein bcgnr5383_36810 [Bacillus cereus]
MKNTRYTRIRFIVINLILFYFLVLLCSLLFKILNNIQLGKFISALFALTFIFSYYHCSSIINTYASLFNIVSGKTRFF